MNDGVPDLADMKRRADERDAIAAATDEAERQEALEQLAQRWDRAMTRAFKGICPRPERLAALRRAEQRS